MSDLGPVVLWFGARGPDCRPCNFYIFLSKLRGSVQNLGTLATGPLLISDYLTGQRNMSEDRLSIKGLSADSFDIDVCIASSLHSIL